MLKKENAGNSSAIITGVLWSTITCISGTAGTGLIYYFTSLPENTLSWTASGLYFISILTGAAVASRRAGRKGLYHGLGVAFIFFLLIWIIATVCFPVDIWSSSLIQKFILAFIGGVMGGILGIAASH